MKTTETNPLVEAAANIACAAAIEWLKAHDYSADMSALTECLRANAKIRLPKALADAKEAFACGMDQIGEATFRAEMALAGIDAAKESFLAN